MGDFNIIDYLVKLPEGQQEIIINKELENIKTWEVKYDRQGNKIKYINGRRVSEDGRM